MGTRKDPKQLGQLMAYVLGHRPDEFGLVPDAEGFVRLKDLLRALSEEPGWGYVRKSHIHEVLITCRADTFVTEDDRIKAAHPQKSVSPVPGVVPPKLLYHCVRQKAYPVVCQEGLSPMGQQHVFLATTEGMALRMGKRRDSKPVLVTVQAQRASEVGVAFFMQGELIYIVDHVPLGYFSGPPLHTASPARELHPGHGARPRASATRVKEKTCQKGDRLEEGCPEVQAKT
jgi:putative RNA 2'-phosphotransferase